MALTTTNRPPVTRRKISATCPGPPRRMSVRLRLWTSSRPIRPAAFLDEEPAQVRTGIAEGRVPGELGLSDRDERAAHPRPVDVARRDTPRLDVGGREQDAVEPAAGDPRPGGAEGPNLRGDVTAQGGVAAADHVDRSAQAPPELEERPAGAAVRFGCGRLGQAARVGQDEAGRPGICQARRRRCPRRAPSRWTRRAPSAIRSGRRRARRSGGRSPRAKSECARGRRAGPAGQAPRGKDCVEPRQRAPRQAPPPAQETWSPPLMS